MIINRKRLAQSKLEKLQRGYSAYVETEEVAQLLEKKLDELKLPVLIEQTSLGRWYTPQSYTHPGELPDRQSN